MSSGLEISGHYESGDLMLRLENFLREDGVDPLRPTIEELAPYDQFHGRGLEATEELATALGVEATDHLLDVGSGIGGPARYFANRFNCKVTGIDLTEEFCKAAQLLTERVGLIDRIQFEQGDALNMSFPDAKFDGAYSMNVSMNVADKGALYAEIHRVLRPGGWLALSELAKGRGGEMIYPTPWAATAASSFLATADETRSKLEDQGFTILSFRDTTNDVLEFGRRSRKRVEQGGKPPQLAVQLIHGELGAEATKNSGRGVAEGRIVPIEVVCQKSG